MVIPKIGNNTEVHHQDQLNKLQYIHIKEYSKILEIMRDIYMCIYRAISQIKLKKTVKPQNMQLTPKNYIYTYNIHSISNIYRFHIHIIFCIIYQRLLLEIHTRNGKKKKKRKKETVRMTASGKGIEGQKQDGDFHCYV